MVTHTRWKNPDVQHSASPCVVIQDAGECRRVKQGITKPLTPVSGLINISGLIKTSVMKKLYMQRSLVFLIGIAIGFGVAYAGSTLEEISEQLDVSSSNETETVIVGDDQSFTTLIEDLSHRRVVYIGETHDRYDHHLNQLAVIKALHENGMDLAIGLEFFQRPYQRHLDDYVAGTIDEKPLLKRSAYYTNWGYDFRLYRPVLEYARENGIALVALNAPKELVSQVSEKGFDGLSAAGKSQLSEVQIPADSSYKGQLEKIFNAHRVPGKNLDRFVQVQLLWDEYMAESAADYLQANPEKRMVVLAGSGHVAVDSGIPQRVHQRVPEAYSVLINTGPVSRGPGSAEYAMLARGEELPKAGKLGLLIRESGRGVTVKRRSGSRVEGASVVVPGDMITSIAGEPVRSLEDVHLAMLDRLPGEEVWIELKRTWNGGKSEKVTAIIELI